MLRLTVAAFLVAAGLQFFLNDFLGAFVACVTAPAAAAIVLRQREPTERELYSGLLPIAAALLGYSMARIADGSFLRSYGYIADMKAVGLALGSGILYGFVVAVGSEWRIGRGEGT